MNMKPHYLQIDSEKGVSVKAWVNDVPLEEAARKPLLHVSQLPFIFKCVLRMFRGFVN